MGLCGKGKGKSTSKAGAPAESTSGPRRTGPPTGPTPANWRSATAGLAAGEIDLVARAARELPAFDLGADELPPIPVAFDVGGFSATVTAGDDGDGAWNLSADELHALRFELDERRLETARLHEEVQVERVKVEQLTARLAASQLDEARSFSEYERERKRAELYYAELKRCYDVLCERGIPVPG